MYNNTLKIIYWICTLAMMLLIFAFSSQDYTNTTNTSNVIVKPLQNAAENSVTKKFNTEEEKKNYIAKLRKNIDSFVRKSAHVILFSVLALFVFLLKKQYSPDDYGSVMFTLAFCLLYAASDEIHQKFAGRTSRFTDVCIDLFGAFLMMLAVYAAGRLKARVKK